uniref:Uncharacterized protein n=1 Tax=Knipowitschia caucasica TaxID=637954 RepID=A0AAV2L9T5_KNICA
MQELEGRVQVSFKVERLRLFDVASDALSQTQDSRTQSGTDDRFNVTGLKTSALSRSALSCRLPWTLRNNTFLFSSRECHPISRRVQAGRCGAIVSQCRARLLSSSEELGAGLGRFLSRSQLFEVSQTGSYAQYFMMLNLATLQNQTCNSLTLGGL